MECESYFIFVKQKFFCSCFFNFVYSKQMGLDKTTNKMKDRSNTKLEKSLVALKLKFICPQTKWIYWYSCIFQLNVSMFFILNALPNPRYRWSDYFLRRWRFPISESSLITFQDGSKGQARRRKQTFFYTKKSLSMTQGTWKVD